MCEALILSSGWRSTVACLIWEPTVTRQSRLKFRLLLSEPSTDGRASSLLPTPTVGDCRSSGRHSTTTGVMHPGTTLTDAIKVEASGPLNPAWVELLMGFPPGYTELD
jgi:hypothetical protein